MKHLLAASLACLLLAPAAWAGADWPMFKYNPAREGSVKHRPQITQPRILWKTPVGLTGWLNSPVIADGMVFVGSSGLLWNMYDLDFADHKTMTDGVYAFDLKTGARKWYVESENDVNQVVWADGKIIATGDTEAVWALDAKSGKQLWSTPLTGTGFQLLPLGSQVIVGDSKGQLAWIDLKSGKINIRTQLDGGIRAGSAASGKTLVTATTQGTVYAFDSEKGTLLWKQHLRDLYPEYAASQMPLEIYNSPVIIDNLVVLGFARDTLYETPALVAFDLKSGKLRWKGAAGAGKSEWGNIRTSPAVADKQLIYAESYSNEVVSIDGTSGQAKNRTAVGAPMFPQWSSPAINEHIAYIPRFDGGLYAIDTQNGQPIWRMYIGQNNLAGSSKALAWLDEGLTAQWFPEFGDSVYASPAISDEGLILIPADGYLYCIGNG